MKKLLFLIPFLFMLSQTAKAQVYPQPPNVGLAANRPTFCATTGQFYYATDTEVLYFSTVAGTSCTWQSVGGASSGFTAGGDLSGTSSSQTVIGINGTLLSGLATGILKITTGTGVPSIAIAADFPTLNQNTSGTASNLSGTPALPNGTTATTQSSGDNSTKLATTAYVAANGVSAGTYYQTSGYTAGSTAATANTLTCSGFVVPPGGLSVGHITFSVSTQDLSNNTDIGIYNSSGTLEAHVGAAASYAAGDATKAFTGGTQTIAAGKAYVCFTSAASTITIFNELNGISFYPVHTISTSSSGGALPGTMTPPSDVFGINNTNGYTAFILSP